MLVDALAEGFIKIEDGVLSAAFPVFEAQTYDRVTELLEPVTEKAGEVMLAYAERRRNCLLSIVLLLSEINATQ